MFCYVHTNTIAKDANELVSFYKEAFYCKSINGTCNLRGERVDRFTGLHQAHITGEYLFLSGYGEDYLTLEIFFYDTLEEVVPIEIDRPSFARLAFEVDDVEETLTKAISEGGSRARELITAEYPNDLEAVFAYAKNPEGSIAELQSWRQRKGAVSK